LNEYLEFKALELEDGVSIDVKLDPFDERSAKNHVKRI
jgi:hypothetical protein